jgi:hypothetical protein
MVRVQIEVMIVSFRVVDRDKSRAKKDPSVSESAYDKLVDKYDMQDDLLNEWTGYGKFVLGKQSMKCLHETYRELEGVRIGEGSDLDTSSSDESTDDEPVQKESPK